MGLSNWQSLLTSSLSTQTLYPTYTKFVRKSMPTANELHTDFKPTASFMNTEISATPLEARIVGTVNISSNKQYDRNIVVENGGHLTISGSALLNATNRTITVQNGGKITMTNSSKIECKAMDISVGGVVQKDSGATITLK